MQKFALTAKSLKKNYNNLSVVSNFDLDIPVGEFFGLLGPNGAGKTTCIHMMASLTQPSEGEAKVFGINVRNRPVDARKKIGLVFQDSALDRQLTVWENLRFVGLLHDLKPATIKNRADHLLNLFGLSEKKQSFVGALSGGQRRIVDIARGVMHEPKLLFLDEPTIGLDLSTRRKIWRYIHKLRSESGMTVLLTTHYLEEAESCERVAFLKNGKIVITGNPKKLVSELAEEIIEVQSLCSSAVLEYLEKNLGSGLIDFDTIFFKKKNISDSSFNKIISDLKSKFGSNITKIIVRKPNLNDVFLWINLA